MANTARRPAFENGTFVLLLREKIFVSSCLSSYGQVEAQVGKVVVYPMEKSRMSTDSYTI